MLNTIHEEFDLKSKLKELQNKKIKIKISKKDGMKDSQIIRQALGESQISHNLNPTPRPRITSNVETIAQSRIVEVVEETRNVVIPFHQTNPLFHSQFIQQTTEVTKLSSLVEVPEKKNIKHSFSKGREGRDTNPLFQSQIPQKKVEPIQTQEIASFVLPKTVTKLIESYEQYQTLLEEHIKNQKLKVDIDLNALKEEINNSINMTRQKLYKQFDEVLIKFQNNFKYLKDKVGYLNINILGFRVQEQPKKLQKRLLVKEVDNDNLRKCQLFYQKRLSLRKILKSQRRKVYICFIRQKIQNIEDEVSKKLMNFIAEEIEKQIFHKPVYNNTETQNFLYNEIKSNILNHLNEQLGTTGHLIFVPPLVDCTTLQVLPKVQVLISDERNNILGGDMDLQELTNLKNTINTRLSMSLTRSMIAGMNTSLGLGSGIKNLSLQLQAKFQTTHSSPLTCLLAINDDTIGTASKDGTVKIWSIVLNKQITKLMSHNGAITCMRLFKGNSKEFKYRENMFTSPNEELSYLCTGGGIGEPVIRIWDLRSNQVIQQLNGHKDAITTMLCLRDMHTLVSGSEDGEIIFWNTYTGIVMDKIEKNFASIHCLTLTKVGKLLVGSSDRTISVYNIEYVNSNVFQRNIFGQTKLELVLEDTCQVYSINTSLLDENLFISGGSDAKIKIWNLATKLIEKEIVGHKSPIAEMIMIENPFDVDKQKMFNIISVGTGEDVIRVSSSLSPLNSGVYLSEKVSCEFGATCAPLLQVIKDQVDQNLKILVLNQDDSSFHFLMLRLV